MSQLQHNANNDTYAKESERYNRKKDYDYSVGKQMNSQTFTDTYIGKTAETKRVNAQGSPELAPHMWGGSAGS